MTVQYERILLLKKVPYFMHLRTDQINRIAQVLEPCGWVKGEWIFGRGDPAERMYVIVKGMVGISIAGPGEPERLVASLKEGEYFGEMGLLDDLPRSATAVVLEDAEAWSLTRDRLRGVLLSYPEFGLGMLKALSLRLRQGNEQLEQLHQSLQHASGE